MTKPILVALALGVATLVCHEKIWARGSEGVGGGDRCEKRFKSVTTQLRSWIENGGAKGLVLGNITPEDYSARMLSVSDAFTVTCVGPGDPGFPVTVNGRPKECKSFRNEKGLSEIICDRRKFYSNLPEPDYDPAQFPMAHHEFASLAGLEPPEDHDSNYEFSQQIEGVLENRLVKKLGVKERRDVRVDQLAEELTLLVSRKTNFDRRLGIYSGGTKSLNSCELRFSNDHVAVYARPELALRPGTYRVRTGNPRVVDYRSPQYRFYNQPMGTSVSLYFTKEQFRIPNYVMESAPMSEKEIVVYLTCTRAFTGHYIYENPEDDRWSLLSEMNNALASIGWEIQNPLL